MAHGYRNRPVEEAENFVDGWYCTDASRASTVGDLRVALAGASAHPERVTLVQAVVPRDDVPDLLAALTRVLGYRPAPAH